MTNRAAAADYPRSGHGALRLLGRAALRLAGWRIVGAMPREPRFVIVVAPHTSNWDFPVGLAAKLALDLEAHWLGKHSLFRWPAGPILRWLGGRPVRRDSAQGVVGEVAEMLRSSDRCVIALAPEGTRRRVAQWRTGFYHIAARAGVPIVPVMLDWGRREVAIGEPLRPTGDVAGDVATIQARYRLDMARRPEGYWTGESPSMAKEAS